MNDGNHEDRPHPQSAASSSRVSTNAAPAENNHQPEIPAYSRNPPCASRCEEHDHQGPRPRHSNEAASTRASQITRGGGNDNSRHSERSRVQVASPDRPGSHSSRYASNFNDVHGGSQRDGDYRASDSPGARDPGGQNGRSSHPQIENSVRSEGMRVLAFNDLPNFYIDFICKTLNVSPDTVRVWSEVGYFRRNRNDERENGLKGSIDCGPLYDRLPAEKRERYDLAIIHRRGSRQESESWPRER